MWESVETWRPVLLETRGWFHTEKHCGEERAMVGRTGGRPQHTHTQTHTVTHLVDTIMLKIPRANTTAEAAKYRLSIHISTCQRSQTSLSNSDCKKIPASAGTVFEVSAWKAKPVIRAELVELVPSERTRKSNSLSRIWADWRPMLASNASFCCCSILRAYDG